MRLLQEVQADVERLAALIDAPDRYLPTYATSQDLARPHVEARDDGLMSWVVVERGVELQRNATYARNELLYWVFRAVTSEMAATYEAAHRIVGEDSRRLLFGHQLRLLERLDPDWVKLRIDELGPLASELGIEIPQSDGPD